MQELISGRRPRVAKTNQEEEIQQQIEEVNPEALQNEVPDKEITSSIKGKIVSITEVPDQVFSERMMGDGFAIIPEDGLITPPVNIVMLNLIQKKLY